MKVENIYPVKWREGEPIKNGQYLCAVIDCGKPVILSWYDDKKQWGEWTHGEYEDGMLEWEYFGNARVLYYMSLDDIPMPEGW